jgi:alpha-tubulin suppressor-like RCC1 family protein
MVATRIAAGGDQSCAVVAGKGLFCWGLGKSDPQRVAGSLDKLSIGWGHGCGIGAGGKVYCWGANRDGQLGDSLAEHEFREVAAGGFHTCAIDGSGAAWCWGKNNYGQLGDGTKSSHSKPMKVRGDRPFKTIAAGSNHTCALDLNGTAWCWGDDFSGAVGAGLDRAELEPVEIAKGKIVLAQIDAGARHTCGLTSGGEAYCWGENKLGQLGQGNRSERIRPGKQVENDITFRQLALGESHSCGIDKAGQIFCWGDNSQGQLGNGSVGEKGARTKPAEVNLDGTATAVAAGRNHTCARMESGETQCWGDNARGQLGKGVSEPQRATPAVVQGGIN